MKPATDTRADNVQALAEPDETYAAVDLGSNSFHLLIARREHGDLRVLDRIREMVRLADGLDENGHLDTAVRDRALECLSRFGQRLRGIPDGNIRAVGTQTFRRMHYAEAFILVAETALGCPVDIIGGREEARLVYMGVSQGVAGQQKRRLVIDIGGGSTELVVGQGHEQLAAESLEFGCVTVTRRFFRDAAINPEQWQAARLALLGELQSLHDQFKNVSWDMAIGSSGTIRAVASICQARGWTDRGISATALRNLEAEILASPSVARHGLPGLSSQRQAVFAGGVVILSACFEALGIEHILVSPYALREGLLQDLLGRLDHRDPRDKTVKAFAARCGVSSEQVNRVRNTALSALDQVGGDDVQRPVYRELLGWAAELHETGLSISHSNYQNHSAYLVEESDMAGFSRQEQQFLAALIRHHRRDIPELYANTLPPRSRRPLRLLLFCLRFAFITCRSRDEQAIPGFSMQREGDHIQIAFQPAWWASHPLTVADLEQEAQVLKVTGLELTFTLTGN